MYDGHLVPLGTAIRRQVRIGWWLLDGNIGSALAGALETLHRQGLVPVDTLVSQPWSCPDRIVGLGGWHPSDAGLRYLRTTCCGYEQLPQGSRCADCSLRNRATGRT